jgi:hypothetical protein
MAEQNYRNHAQVVPAFHYGVFLPLLVNIIWTAYQLTQGVTGERLIAFMMGWVFALLALTLRQQVLRVQDRVIRFEMRHRLREVLPTDVAARATDLHVKQLVALRFASDTELPDLVDAVLNGQVSVPKEIKQKVKNWQADLLRA